MSDRYSLAASLIRVFEGLRTVAYPDTGGVPTIGFGHTAGVHLGDTCTEAQAQAWLAADAAPLFSLVSDKPDPQAAAWVSFGYNTGKHTLEMALAGTAHMENYIHDRHGNVLNGLIARRTLEKALIDL